MFVVDALLKKAIWDFFINIIICFCNSRLEIVSAILDSNKWKTEISNSAAQELNNIY